MASRGPRLKNDPNRRMDNLVAGADIGSFDLFPGWEELDPANVPHWVETLRRAEANARLLRKRLEALAVEEQAPTCAHCGVEVFGRAGKVYCSAACRQAAHRARDRVVRARVTIEERPPVTVRPKVIREERPPVTVRPKVIREG